MYEYAITILRKNHIDKVFLEVITTNETALKTYKSLGFKITKTLNCFKGSLEIANTHNDFEIRRLGEYDWQKLLSFWDLIPSWQNSITAVDKLRNENISIGMYQSETLIGYAIFNPKIKRIHQLAVDKDFRKLGIGQKFLAYISIIFGKEISVTNIDSRSTEISKFLMERGMKIFIQQYGMELKLT